MPSKVFNEKQRDPIICNSYGLSQGCSNSIANALELLQSYTKPSKLFGGVTSKQVNRSYLTLSLNVWPFTKKTKGSVALHMERDWYALWVFLKGNSVDNLFYFVSSPHSEMHDTVALEDVGRRLTFQQTMPLMDCQFWSVNAALWHAYFLAFGIWWKDCS